MRRVLLALGLACGLAAATSARAQNPDTDLEGDDKKGTPDSGFGVYVPPAPATIKGHAYTLAECLALTDRNHPQLWAARARLAYTHAQLSEAKWLPFWQWQSNFGMTVVPPIPGTYWYTSAPFSARNLSFTDGLQPLVHFDINGTLPLYTFGKIESGRRAADANVRVSEWDLEKTRQQTRMDVRRAYFGVMLARDAKYLADEVLSRIDKAIKGVDDKIAKGDQTVAEVDRLRLEVYREEIIARAGEAQRGETYALAALRFFTGVQELFDVPDEPLKPPDVPLAPVIRYLSAARLFRPEVNMARAGVEARKAQVDLARAKFFPDIGLTLGADYTRAPSATTQNVPWIFDPLNHFFYYGGFGLHWNLDLLPNAARVAQAESQLEETRALERAALGGLAVEVENAYATAVEAKGRSEAWDRAEHKSKQWITTIQDAIDLGNGDERALTEPLRAYVNSRLNHLISLMDYNIAMSQLALASGWDSAAPGGT
jgi:multidrug efflux system outer membrane protein